MPLIHRNICGERWFFGTYMSRLNDTITCKSDTLSDIMAINTVALSRA